MTEWTAALRLWVTVPGQAPVIVEQHTRVERAKTPFTGLTLPVAVDLNNPSDVRILWDEAPTIQERIARRYQLILAPEAAWRDVLEADPTQADLMPDWGEERVPGWTPGAALKRGREAATALVVGHSWDPRPNGTANGATPSWRLRYRHSGRSRASRSEFLGWMLLCVIPPEGPRYGVYLQTKIRRDRLGPVLPVAVNEARRELVICWDDAPVPTELEDAFVASQSEEVLEPSESEEAPEPSESEEDLEASESEEDPEASESEEDPEASESEQDPEASEPEVAPAAAQLELVAAAANGSNGNSPHIGVVAAPIGPIEEYLCALEEPKRSTLEAMRRTILEIVPEAEEVISHGVPAFRLDDQVVAGVGARKAHLSYLPFSDSVLSQLDGELDEYKTTKKSLHFPIDQALPRPLVEQLIELRLQEIKQRED